MQASTQRNDNSLQASLPSRVVPPRVKVWNWEDPTVIISAWGVRILLMDSILMKRHSVSSRADA